MCVQTRLQLFTFLSDQEKYVDQMQCGSIIMSCD
jgi:hypothetical protein